jgi:hypothetical protein
VKQSHKVQSVRGVVEQTIRDLKCFKVMESNKINSAEKFEKVLDCVIALHNLKVLLKHDPNFKFLSAGARFQANTFFVRCSRKKMWI